MKKEIYEKSVQNARIDLNIKTGKVKFGFPTKKRGRLWEIWNISMLIIIPYWILIGSVLLIQVAVVTDWTDIILQREMAEIRVNIIESTIQVGRIIFCLIIPPFIIAIYPVLINRNLLRKIPKLQLFINKNMQYQKCYVARFENIKTKQVSIPLFRNIILKYEADGDYAKLLKNIEIKEHPFMEVMRSEKGVIVKPNEYLWKADITFDKVPKKGKIDLFFM